MTSMLQGKIGILVLLVMLSLTVRSVPSNLTVPLNPTPGLETNISQRSERASPQEHDQNNTKWLADVLKNKNQGHTNLTLMAPTLPTNIKAPVGDDYLIFKDIVKEDRIIFADSSALHPDGPMKCWTCSKLMGESGCRDPFLHNALNGPSACHVFFEGWATDLCLRYPGGFRIVCKPNLKISCQKDCITKASNPTGTGTVLPRPPLLYSAVLAVLAVRWRW